jgi:hypothetical protein
MQYLPPKRSEPGVITMLRHVAPVLEPVIDDDGNVDREQAIPLLAAAVADALDDLRGVLAGLNRFDAIKRVAFREVAHDPNTYVEHEHDGLVSILLVVMSVAAEFDVSSPDDPPDCTPERVELLHAHAALALHLAQLHDAFRRPDDGGHDAGRLALLREVNWGPPSWPEDQDSLLEELFSGVGDRILRSITGFSAEDLFAVVGALNEAARYMTILTIVEPRPMVLPRRAVHEMAGIDAASADRVIDWFSTGVGQPRVTDPLDAARARRMKPMLAAGDEICWATPDLLPWALQLSFEEVLKGTANFNPYQRHRSKVLERQAVSALADVLRPELEVAGGKYTGSHGDGEVDGLLIVDRVAVILEAKAQMLTTRARSGDPTRLEHNLGEILGTGSEQIGRFIRTLRDDGKVHFHNRNITIEASSIDNTFGVITTLDELNALAVATLEIAELGVEIDQDALPMVLSLHGIREACRLLDEPWSLLHYLHRRRETSRRVEIFAPEELDVVMLHLRRSLFFDDLPEGTLVEVGVETDPLDAWSYYRRGLRSRPARKPSQKVPLHVMRLLDGLQTERPRGWTHAVFHLLDFSATGRSNVNRMIKETRTRIRQDHQKHDFTIGTDTDTPAAHGITVVLGPDDCDDLEDRAHFLTHLNGLRGSAARWLGIAVKVAGETLSPVAVIAARPPFEQVVPPDRVLPTPAWQGARRVTERRAARR